MALQTTFFGRYWSRPWFCLACGSARLLWVCLPFLFWQPLLRENWGGQRSHTWPHDMLHPRITASSSEDTPFQLWTHQWGKCQLPSRWSCPNQIQGSADSVVLQKRIKMGLRYRNSEERIRENPDAQHLVAPMRGIITSRVEMLVSRTFFWQFNVIGLGKLTESSALPMWWEILLSWKIALMSSYSRQTDFQLFYYKEQFLWSCVVFHSCSPRMSCDSTTLGCSA